MFEFILIGVVCIAALALLFIYVGKLADYLFADPKTRGFIEVFNSEYAFEAEELASKLCAQNIQAVARTSTTVIAFQAYPITRVLVPKCCEENARMIMQSEKGQVQVQKP